MNYYSFFVLFEIFVDPFFLLVLGLGCKFSLSGGHFVLYIPMLVYIKRPEDEIQYNRGG